MKTRKKKGLFWGVAIAAMILVINVLHYLFGGHSSFAGGRHGHGPGPGAAMGHQGGFGQHQGGGFPWLGLLIGLAIVIFLVRWFRKKAKASSMKQFINTPLVGSHIPVINQNANMLDQWEKNVTNKKESV
jgi:hypothetical protein